MCYKIWNTNDPYLRAIINYWNKLYYLKNIESHSFNWYLSGKNSTTFSSCAGYNIIYSVDSRQIRYSCNYTIVVKYDSRELPSILLIFDLNVNVDVWWYIDVENSIVRRYIKLINAANRYQIPKLNEKIKPKFKILKFPKLLTMHLIFKYN